MELGLDAYLAAREGGSPASRPLTSFPAFAPLLAAAYRRTYGESGLAVPFERALRALRRWAPLVLALSRSLGQGQRLARGVPRFAPMAAPTSFGAPPPALLLGAHRAFDRAVAEFERHIGTDLLDLTSVDLDTGQALSTTFQPAAN